MFLIFVGSHDEGGTLGGWADFHASATSLDDALAAARDIQEQEEWVQWWQIVDVATLSVVASFSWITSNGPSVG